MIIKRCWKWCVVVISIFFSSFPFFHPLSLTWKNEKNIEDDHYDDDEDDDSDNGNDNDDNNDKDKTKRPWTIGCVATLFALFPLFKAAKIVCLFHVISFTLKNKNKNKINKNISMHSVCHSHWPWKRKHMHNRSISFGSWNSLVFLEVLLHLSMQSNGTWKVSQSIFQDRGVCMAFDC